MAVAEEDCHSLSCAICMEIFDKPMTTSCGHTFCKDCLSPFGTVREPHCPICRTLFDPAQLTLNHNIERVLASKRGKCSGCKREMLLSKLRHHTIKCSKLRPSKHTFKPVAASSQPIPSMGPNRSTFKCPYCGMSNLDNQGLISHCNESHQTCNTPVVCPICAIMPWGDPNQKSANFIRHLNLRHKFEYDVYVDYQQEEEDMLQAALKASLHST